ncbi:MAG: glycosyltransferase family 9 protein [Cyanobacteriota bacterium]|nr:glycosyltransferase family 9 protein [Cyanobacteriota bacterium]
MHERILALVPGGIGDQILFFPTLAGLRQRFPQAEIEVMVEPRAAGAYEVCPSVDRVLTFAFKEQVSLGDLSDLLGRIRERQYDGVVSLGRSWGLKLLLWLTGIPKRVGYGQTTGPWLTDAVPLKEEQYAASMYADLLQGFPGATTTPLPQIRLKKPALDWCEQERQRLFGDKSDYVLIHPGASQISINKGIQKIYPVERWLEIMQGFQKKRPELPMVLLIGPEDQELAQAFLDRQPDLYLTRPRQISQLTGMIAGATLLLCTDSAPMHLAVATQTPLLALFGPTDPHRLLPSQGPYRWVRAADQKITSILPAQVLQTLFPA